MAIFGSTRQRFLDCFEKRDDGFAYRRTLHSRPVLVTAGERTWLIADYDDRRLAFWIMLPATVPIAVLALVLVEASTLSSTAGGVAVWLSFVGFPLLSGIWTAAGRWRLLRRRPYIDGRLSKAEAERRRSRNLTWPVLVLSASSAALWCWTVVRSNDAHPAWRTICGVLGVAVLVVAAWEGRAKIRHGREAAPGDVER